ncbi:hypothetical protein BJ322DRAFT_1019351 [Thelephora terrestris]|uniref:Uncharacterized protein n=1 Tax=Thelephora terrestris TaxID=56493 RepID=A0A9P6HI56_9AGAM|nr:hypothetical protein BJ322DRAFT_1019351 [Thelephora terrestris]
MLAGPYPPTHASSFSFNDAMERRGRSRAVPTTTAIRKSYRHQRQLYYSHNPVSPPSPSLSPAGSPRHLTRSDDSTSPQSTTLEILTPPEFSLDYYDSPPSPPQSLEDQIHEAYALDNIHLAKILYLKLQGVQVVDDSDPRIEQVQEEDFPFGKLILDEEDERSLKECQKRETHRRRDQQRANKLIQCERAWDQSIVEYRQQCLLVQQRKRVAALVLDAADWERGHRAPEHSPRSGARSLLSHKSPYSAPLQSVPSGPYPLEYSVPTSPTSPVDIPSRSPKTSYLCRGPPISSPSHPIPFRQVSACMNGSLFSDDDAPSELGARKRQSHAHTTLLELLLQPVTWERGERSEARVRRRSSLPSFGTWSSNATLCSACSPPSGTPSTIASSHSAHQFVSIPRPTISLSKPITSAPSARARLSLCGAHSLTPIDLQECPLSFPSQPQPNAPLFVQQPKSRSRFAKRLARKITSSVSALVDVAAQFQASYLRTAGSIIQYEADSFFDETAVSSWGAKPLVGSAKAKTWLPFNPANPRANISEVTAFMEGSAWSDLKEDVYPEQEHYTLVELLSPSERFLPPPSTSEFVTPSPLRPRDASISLRCRIRPIANPVLLRLKALQNVCADQGFEWEGRAREGALGFGRDRLQGVAFEGIGRSRLSWEVSF